jgi:DNA-binding XRE family transcriptional regulator
MWLYELKSHFAAPIPKIIEFLGYIPFDMQFEDLWQKIYTYRQFLGLRQKDLARQIGVDPSAIGSWERGKHKPANKDREKTFCVFLSSSRNILPQLKHQNF